VISHVIFSSKLKLSLQDESKSLKSSHTLLYTILGLSHHQETQKEELNTVQKSGEKLSIHVLGVE